MLLSLSSFKVTFLFTATAQGPLHFHLTASDFSVQWQSMEVWRVSEILLLPFLYINLKNITLTLVLWTSCPTPFQYCKFSLLLLTLSVTSNTVGLIVPAKIMPHQEFSFASPHLSLRKMNQHHLLFDHFKMGQIHFRKHHCSFWLRSPYFLFSPGRMWPPHNPSRLASLFISLFLRTHLIYLLIFL